MKIRFNIAFLISPILFDNISSTLCCETCNKRPAVEFKMLAIRFNAVFIAVCVTEFMLGHIYTQKFYMKYLQDKRELIHSVTWKAFSFARTLIAAVFPQPDGPDRINTAGSHAWNNAERLVIVLFLGTISQMLEDDEPLVSNACEMLLFF
ncbi:unnamed protein product [Xylocopa violacea]|uniref:Uncharacterized protein n=1 Tax=Xylocopa violacea TaxID=135666 RepID=A0ABP1P1C7_XYLVO